MKKYILVTGLLVLLFACQKQEKWLDVKSTKSDVIPTTLKDFQALMDNTSVMTHRLSSMGIIGSDHIALLDAVALNSGNASERNAYRWLPDIYNGQFDVGSADWDYPYAMISYCNIVLDGSTKLVATGAQAEQWNALVGSAYFFRALAYYQLVHLYARPYQEQTAATDLGIPLKLSSDVNERPSRGTLKQTYDQMLEDLFKALALLPEVPLYKTRPSKAAVNGLLAKTYLHMQRYDLALKHTEEALKTNRSLLNFNQLNGSATLPFPTYQIGNPEIIFYANTISYTTTSISSMLISDELLDLYALQDLRRTLFVRENTNGTKGFKGRYSGTTACFGGLATNELYLIKAECQARTGQWREGLQTLNELLVTRWLPNSYQPYAASNETEALRYILNERRKELPFTGNLRWEDLRRLNLDPRFAKTLQRVVGGVTYILPPNDLKYTLPIVPAEMALNPMPQNPRQ